jgi:hypothetical protein
MTTQASQARSKSVRPVGGGTPMTGSCTVGVIQAKLSLFGLGMLVLACLVVDTSWAQGEVSFIRQDFRVGDGPFEVIVGDFNGDSQQDLATSDLSCATPTGHCGSVFIVLGRGDGTFEPAQDFTVGGNSFSVTAGDFNGDGQQDLASANLLGGVFGSVSILLGKGDGTFEPAQDFAVGGAPLAVSVGDFNGDGQQDLATANDQTLTVSILLGNGDGTFEPAQNSAVGGPPRSITVGDFDSDGRQDLATDSGDSVSVLLGNGDGTFEPAQDFAVGRDPVSVKVGDFNGDGQQDLATANSGGNSDHSVSVLLGQGDGTFEPARDFGVGLTPFSVAVGDFNADGQQDLATANSNGFSVSILLGQGDGTFEPARDFAVGLVPRSVAVGDFNGDSRQDLAAANNFAGTLSILINNTAVEIVVKIDIKPGSFPNSINPKSNGVIPVAVLTTDRFDASALDASTVFFGASGSEAAAVHSALKDVDGDGDTDMILHFRTQNTSIQCGHTSASLTGSTFSGQAIEGSDSIRTVGCKQRS